MADIFSLSSPNAETRLLQVALKQCTEQLDETIALIPPDIFTAINTKDQSCIGKHFRHIIEFMQILDQQAASGTVDYELRNRVEELEQNPVLALEALRASAAQISKSLDHLGQGYTIMHLQTPFVGGQKLAVPSSLGREVLYVIEHAIHHLALIKFLGNRFGIEFPHEVGVAVATLEYEQRQRPLSA